jgi:hypothetical protein
LENGGMKTYMLTFLNFQYLGLLEAAPQCGLECEIEFQAGARYLLL